MQIVFSSMIKTTICDVAAVRRVKIIHDDRGFVYEYKYFVNSIFRSYTETNRVNRSYTDLFRMSFLKSYEKDPYTKIMVSKRVST